MHSFRSDEVVMANDKEPDKLAQDAAAALAAGMSYGKWKAMQNPSEIDKPPLPADWRVCVRCGKPYKPKTKRKQLYCDVFCQKRAQKERQQQKQ